MKKTIIVIVAAGVFLGSCNPKKGNQAANNGDNPFFGEYTTPYKVPPFDLIKPAHYMPAFKEGMKQQIMEIKKITDNKEAPTFANTIEAFENTGKLLGKVSDVFYNISAAESNDEIRQIEKDLAPLTTKHRADIMLNEELFKRVKVVFDQKDKLNLTAEQEMLLTKNIKNLLEMVPIYLQIKSLN